MSHRVWLLGLLLLCACGPEPPPNILLVIIDTLRTDRVGVYGNDRELTPSIDQLAQRGVVFRNAYAQSSWTKPSIASLMTSRFQSQHGVLTLGSVLDAREITLAEVLKDGGYSTAAFTANPSISDQRGFSQGFQKFEMLDLLEKPKMKWHLWVHERAATINARALSWLDSLPADRPVFLYLHYMEPHAPYDPPDATLSRLSPNLLSLDKGELNARANSNLANPISDAMAGDIKDLYDAEIMDVDSELGKMFDSLDSRGFLDHSVVVVTSDHGEEFLDHGDMGHAKSLFNEVVSVPLIIAVSGYTSRREVAAVTSLIDVAPSLVELAGVAIPSTFVGRSLVAWLTGAAEEDRSSTPTGVALSELLDAPFTIGKRPKHYRTIIVGDQKLIINDEARSRMELFDLASDPLEREPSTRRESELESLQNALDRILDTASANPTQPRDTPLDEHTLERLKALGYVP